MSVLVRHLEELKAEAEKIEKAVQDFRKMSPSDLTRMNMAESASSQKVFEPAQKVDAPQCQPAPKSL